MSTVYLRHISGMKGMGALIVLLHHFFYCFYPLFCAEGQTSSCLERIPVVNLFLNGNFAVCLFLILSGYLVSLQCSTYHSLSDYGEAVSKRYLRLALPLLVPTLFSYLLYSFGLFRIHEVSAELMNGMTVDYYQNIKPRHLLASLVLAPFGYSVLNGPYWMLDAILLGSYLVMLVHLACGNLSMGKRLLLLCFILSITYYYQPYYACPLIGVLLREMDRKMEPLKDVWRHVMAFILLGIAIALCCLQEGVFQFEIHLNVLSACCFILSVLVSPLLRALFSLRAMDGVGRISMGIYVFHWPVICSFSCWLFLHGRMGVSPWMMSGLFLLSAILVVMLAWAYHKWVEPIAAKTGRMILQRFFSEQP